MRAYLVAFSLTSFLVGIPIRFAGYVRIGCTVNQSGAMTVFSNCGGADRLELIGGVLVAFAAVFLVASFVPSNESRYK